MIYDVDFKRHLGHIVGLKSQQRAVEGYAYDFNNNLKVNMLMSYFICASHHTLSIYCMSLYETCLWDLTSTHCERFYTTWRKAVRRINRLNPRIHNDLLHSIINVKPISSQVYSRFLKFANSTYTVKNDIRNLCGHVASVNPISSYCKNINAILYNIRLCDVQLSSKF